MTTKNLWQFSKPGTAFLLIHAARSDMGNSSVSPVMVQAATTHQEYDAVRKDRL